MASLSDVWGIEDNFENAISAKASEEEDVIVENIVKKNENEELVKNLDMQRQFEINVKLIKKASDIDSATTKLMSLPT